MDADNQLDAIELDDATDFLNPNYAEITEVMMRIDPMFGYEGQSFFKSSPERNLMASVLISAYLDLTKNDALNKEAAIAFFAEEKIENELYSLESICSTLKIPKSRAKKKARDILTSLAPVEVTM